MSRVYKLNPDGTSIAMRSIRCQDEGHELQEVLERNLDLLPGEQINPDDPRRWLLVKREMPVPDPNSGADRWSIDFVLLDQEAIPTFVECKRFADTRSRREVIGQMLEYAANGHHYWTGEQLRRLAEESARRSGSSLEEAFHQLVEGEELEIEEFFQRAEENLRQGHIRLVFFLEEAPFELKSVVDFLNKQTERTEVLLVEARRYALEGITIIVPTLFGYTEEARRAKQAAPSASRAFKQWNEELFFEALAENIGEEGVMAVRSLYERVLSRGFKVSWGRGAQRGSLGVKALGLSSSSLFTVWTDGRLQLNFGWLVGSEVAEAFCEAYWEEVGSRLGWSLPAHWHNTYPSFLFPQWSPQMDDFLNLIEELVARFSTQLDPAC
ncbi:MAG: hypothetical protein J7M05_09490 [Anaerolineae bacterium]|nr:hypothetical protein [Anaerolineae bacterium]